MSLSNVILYLMPELIILVAVGIVLMVAVSKLAHSKLSFYISQIAIVAAFIASVYLCPTQHMIFFNNQYVVDPLAYLLKAVVFVVVFFVFLYGRGYVAEKKMAQSEFYALGLVSLFGMSVLVSTNNLLSLYLALECMSLPIYAMVALERTNPKSIEAAMKYFVMGAFASGLLLYGMSMLFGATGSLDMPTIAQYAHNLGPHHMILLSFGLVFLLAGICFKLGAAPFHMWVPDVYEGAPTNVTLFMSSAPKLAAFALLIRMLVMTLPVLTTQWHEVMLVVAVLSIALGNILAIVQDNIKRLLAYSSIAHMGYVLLAFSIATPAGEEAALFYLVCYAIMTVGAFGIITLMSQHGREINNLEDLAGLNSQHSWLAFLMLLLMFSMAGVPPIIGFIAKMRILEALMQAHMIFYAVLALLFAIIGAYYYLRVVMIMYFREPKEEIKTSYSRPQALAIGLNSLAVLALGIYPVPLFHICSWVFVGH